MLKHNMMKYLLFILTGLSVSFSAKMANAQQVYQSGHYGGPGDLYLYNRFSPGAEMPLLTATGENITWDLAADPDLNTHINQFVQPAQAINQFTFLTICALSGFSAPECFTLWNNTQQALLLADSLTLIQFSLNDIQRFQRKTNNFLLENFFGFTVDLGGGTPTAAVIVYNRPDTILHFPVMYGRDWTSHVFFNIDLTAVGQDLNYSSKQIRTTSIDSWGTIYTPYDTFSHVIRLRSDIARTDTLRFDTLAIPLTFTQVEYMWFDTSYQLPVMTANGILGDQDTIIINAFEYIYNSDCPSPSWTVEAGSDVFYLGPDGTVTIDFTIENSNANTYVWDFGDGTLAETEGDVSHTYNAPGQYAIAIIGCMTHCLPLNSCSFQIIDFEIVDTTTSISPVAGSDLGVALFPNPAKDLVHIYIPSGMGEQAYVVYDLTGRKVAFGQLVTGHSMMPFSELHQGTYILHLSSFDAPHSPGAIMRFVMMRGE